MRGVKSLGLVTVAAAIALAGVLSGCATSTSAASGVSEVDARGF